MRIIAGEHRGRRIAAPPGRGTRPMLDRVREALFSTLGELVTDARVLDLCAGSGSLGLEALSRGARSARLVERDRKTLAVLRSNVEALGAAQRAEIVAGDAVDASSWGGADARYELVFFDPPYPWLRAGEQRTAVLRAVQAIAAEYLAPEGVLVLHAPKGLLAADSFGSGLLPRLREYGSNALWYLRRSGVEQP
jgi:16S rRNA (guanine(966)-N(2))-methyltransferase RsmD